LLARSDFSDDCSNHGQPNPVLSPAQVEKKQATAMSKLARILATILIAFALSSLLLYRLRLDISDNRQLANQPPPRIVEETRTVEGQIQVVDSASNTLTVINDGQELMFALDERTAILESGTPVQPATIVTGTPAKIKYTQHGSKRWARRIELSRAEPASPAESY
jgi:hypothetical protein